MMDQPTNNQRAAWAKAALDAFVKECGDAGDVRDNIADLLCNLRHLCDAHDIDHGKLFAGSCDVYLEEIGEQPPANEAYLEGALPPKRMVALNEREAATMIAALWMWQHEEAVYHEEVLASDDGKLEPLDEAEIDALAKRIEEETKP